MKSNIAPLPKLTSMPLHISFSRYLITTYQQAFQLNNIEGDADNWFQIKLIYMNTIHNDIKYNDLNLVIRMYIYVSFKTFKKTKNIIIQ